MAAVLRLALICRNCDTSFTAGRRSPGRRDMLCFWCWLFRIED
jgi:hypothetical protein